MRVFDIHTHIFPDKIAARTVESIGKASNLVPSYDGTRRGLEKALQSAGIDGALNCPIATKPDQVASINNWASDQNRWPILSLGSVHPEFPDLHHCIQRVHEAGLRGIKVHPEYQQFALDDPRMTTVWEACHAHRLIVMLHSGADIAFAPPFRSTPDTVAALISKYPGMQLIAAHFGGWEMWDAVENELLGKRLYLDTSFTLGRLPDETVVRLMRKHGVDKVLFGTDAPWRDQKADLEHFLRLPLTHEEQQAILWDNAAALLRLPEGRRPESNT